MQKSTGFWIILSVFVMVFLFFPSLTFGYGWPIGDGATQKRINGTFGEFRPPSGSNPPYNTNHFHDGVDIPASYGTYVYGVQQEKVWEISYDWDYVKTDYHDFRHIVPNASLYADTLIDPLVRLGWIDSEKHLHFSQEDYRTGYGYEYNPLVQGFSNHLSPFEDSLKPIIEHVKLVNHETQQEFPHDTIRGNVDIIVKVSDRIPYPPNGVDYDNGIYGVGYAIEQSGWPWKYNVQFDFWPYVRGWNIDYIYAESSDIDDYYYIATNKMNADTFWNSRNVYDGWWKICIDVYDQSFNSRYYYLPVYVHNDITYIYGDIDMDGTPYTSADAVLLARALIFGAPVVFWDLEKQMLASDVNRDGRTFMLSDLIFLIQIMQGLLPRIWGPFHKLTPTSQSVDFIVKRDSSKIMVSTASEASLSGALLVFKHNGLIDSPELLYNGKMQLMWSDHNGELKILIWSPNGDVIPSGETELFSFTCSGEIALISVEAVDSEIRELKPNIIQDNTNWQPSKFLLCQNYPNPFNPETEIKYSLAKNDKVKLVVYNVLGRKVRALVDEYQTAGNKSVHWDGKDESGNEVGSGIYFYQIQTGDFVQTKKMTLLR